MKALLLSDLHCDPAKLDWVAEHAGAFDVVAVAGDLLNIFSSVDPSEQQETVLRWKKRILAAGSSLVWCSGNHDFFHGEDSPIVRASPDWMTGSDRNFVGDGATELLTTKSGTLAVTTIPWPVTGADVSVEGHPVAFVDHIQSLLEAGKRLQQDHPWLVLIHEPPIETKLSVDYFAGEARFTRTLIETWAPDWSLHGHIHESFAAVGGSFSDRLETTTCFNAGQSADGADPHNIVLRLEKAAWSARWNGAGSQRFIDGLLPRQSFPPLEAPATVSVDSEGAD